MYVINEFTIYTTDSDGNIAQGIYHGSMNYSSLSDDYIDSAQLLPYPVSEVTAGNRVLEGSNPLSISLTEFHFILLYKDRVAGICNLNDTLAYEEMLPLVIGLI